MACYKTNADFLPNKVQFNAKEFSFSTSESVYTTYSDSSLQKFSVSFPFTGILVAQKLRPTHREGENSNPNLTIDTCLFGTGTVRLFCFVVAESSFV